MVVHGDREIFFCTFLADNVLVEIFLDLSWRRHFSQTDCRAFKASAILLDNVVAQVDTFGANKDVVRAFYKCVNVASAASAKTAYYSASFIFR